MTYLSVQATSIQSITRTLTWALRAHLGPVAEKAAGVLFPAGVPPGVDMRAVCLGVTGSLERHADDVAHRDREVARERTEDDEARAGRDFAVAELRSGLFLIRDASSGAYGVEILGALGLDGRIPEQGDPLLAFARNTATKLPALATRSSTKTFVQFDVVAAAADLDQLANNLSDALTTVARDMRETQMAQAARNEAIERWRVHYVMVANLIEGLLRMAGFDHVADRVRPTRRRRAGEAEPEDGLETQPVTPPAGTPANGIDTPAPAPVAPARATPAE
jgi:hypothetical protein